jgi:hypothetical protein
MESGIVYPMRLAGRPEIGRPINIRLGNKLLAAVDAEATSLNISRPEVIRRIVAEHFKGTK